MTYQEILDLVTKGRAVGEKSYMQFDIKLALATAQELPWSIIIAYYQDVHTDRPISLVAQRIYDIRNPEEVKKEIKSLLVTFS